MNKAIVTRKIREWLNRYLGAEIVGTIAALSCAWIGHLLTGSLVVAALAGSYGEGIAYYGYLGFRESRRHYRQHSQHPPLRRYLLTILKTARDMMVEFGVAEVLDSLLFRPFCMYIGPRLLHNFPAGIVAGKIVADIGFYSIAIVCYEFKKRWDLD